MIITYFLTFVGGVLADIARKVIVPQTEDWLERCFPRLRRERNVQRNLLQLEVRERLLKMGCDPTLAADLHEEPEKWLSKLEQRQSATREAFADLEAERLAAGAQTQVEMNQSAFDRFEAADRLLDIAVERFKADVPLSETAGAALEDAQKAWKEFRASDAEFEGLAAAEGGSMRSLAHALVMEAITIERIGRLNALRDELANR